VRLRPTLEALETRNLLSSLTVTNLLDTGVSGDGSLRGEISAAAQGDQIVFAGSLAGQTITLNAAEGPLVLSKNLTIQGPGAGRLTISGNDATRVFEIAAGATDTIAGLTIARGSADGNTDFGAGGIFNNGGATLTLDGCTLSGNHADRTVEGGGAITNGGTLTINNSTLSGNRADHAAFAGNTNAGGIFNFATLTINQSTLSGNHADGDNSAGGGIFNFKGTVTIANSTLSGNTADNDAHDGGGGIFNFQGKTTIDQSNVSGNHADGNTTGGGGLYNFSTKMTVANSTLSGNTADHDTTAGGGGILNSAALTLDQSTVSDGIDNVGKGTVTVVAPPNPDPAMPPTPAPAERGVVASLLAVGRKRKRLLVVERFADTGAVKRVFVSPFQRPRFRHIAVTPVDVNGVAEFFLVTAVCHGKLHSEVLPA
jgi:hypothetical protein